MAKATTIRFTDDMYARLDRASSWTGLPVNSIVVAACLEWMSRHTPDPGLQTLGTSVTPAGFAGIQTPPRWATLRRAVKLATDASVGSAPYPFERFTDTAQNMLRAAQNEVEKGGHSYIGTEHLLLAVFALPESQAGKALASLGVQEAPVRADLAALIGSGKQSSVRRVLPTNRVKRVIDLAFKLCGAAGDPRVSSGHILLALASEGEGIAAHMLKDRGATVERIESTLDANTELEP